MANQFYAILNGDEQQGRALWLRVAEQAVQGHYELSPEEKAVVARLADETYQHHRLRGAWSSDHRILVAQVLDHDRLEDWKKRKVSGLVWGWPGAFGGTFTLTLKLHGADDAARAAIPAGDAFLDVIKAGPFAVAFVHGKQIVRCDRLDYSETAEGQLVVDGHLQTLVDERPRAWLDRDANYWETLKCQTTFSKYLTRSDRLSLGWIEQHLKSKVVRTAIETLNVKRFSETCSKLQLSSTGQGLVDAIERCQGDFAIVRCSATITFPL